MKRLFLLMLATTLTAQVRADLQTFAGFISAENVGREFCVSGVVTRCSPTPGGFFLLQDDTCAVSLFNHTSCSDGELEPGNEVIAAGRVNLGINSRRPVADVTEVTLVARDRLPAPLDVTARQLADPSLVNRLVRIGGIVTDAFRDEFDREWFFLVLSCKNSTVYIACRQRVKDEQFESLVGKEITAVGFNKGGQNSNRRMITRSIEILSLDGITTLTPKNRTDHPAPDIESFSFLDEPRSSNSVVCSAKGRILAAWKDGNVLLRTASGSLVKGEISKPPFPVFGERIELVGHPETDLYDPILVRASFRRIAGNASTPPEAEPRAVTVADIHANDPMFRHYDFSLHGRTVKIRGIIRAMPIPGGDGQLALECSSRIVTADVSSVPGILRGLENGFGVELTGVCIMQAEKMSLNRTTPLIRGFVIVPRTADDIRIVSRPSWWTPGRSLAAIALLLTVLTIITLWNLALRHIAEKRAHQLAEEEISHVKSELKVSERTRLAVELHDTLAQNITGACLKMNAAEQLFESDPKAAAEHLDVATKTLASCRNEIRNCLWDLRSQALEENTMSNAIRRTLEPHLDGDVDISVRFEVPRAIFTDNTAHILLSIVRELVLNALRHGRAKAVRIVGCAENGNILFSVQDNGCGFDPETAPGVRQGHFGLQGIRERVKTLNGDVCISSGRKAGTKVRITMPLPAGKGEKV